MFSGGEKTLSILLSAGGLFELYTYWRKFACSNNIKIISMQGRFFIGKIFKKFLCFARKPRHLLAGLDPQHKAGGFRMRAYALMGR
jgi:hypothetical protein